ncbi:MAG: DUF3990 domain-containing protein [Prevotellaceae bacterium]|jgi:hypothetical protein|nr:DUF3990 domain-containing protein [Prevotellaceae bacterium]
MRVFHGSYTAIDRIDLSQCQPNKDFGRGFYVTKLRKQAESWAEIIGDIRDMAGVVSEFIFCERAFADDKYKILRFEDYSEAWLDFVILNRNRESTEQKHDYDIVEGPIADDRISRRIDDYLDGKVSKQKFLEELKHNKDNHQICFCTLNSLQMLEKTDTKYSRLITDISESVIENLMTELHIDEEKAADMFYNSTIFSELSNENTKFYEKPLQEIYEMLKKELKT